MIVGINAAAAGRDVIDIGACRTEEAYFQTQNLGYRKRAENTICGGEMSVHHYFRDFAYCDTGMSPWLYDRRLDLTQRTVAGENGRGPPMRPFP